ncbi:MAG: hypothetical protein GW799_00420 [Shewanella frigidimarina]|nr:hypothetical protein [Shewanella frigidimarina]
MPLLIKYLNKIAREKQRGILFLSFLNPSMVLEEILKPDRSGDFVI